MTRLACLVTLTAALAGSLAADASPALAAPIVGGSADTGDPAVVMLAAYPPDKSTLFTCTAEVITPTRLMTAGHCVDHDADFIYGVFFGDNAPGQLTDLIPQLAPVASTTIYPGYVRTSPFIGDIAVVDLATPTDVTPLPYAHTAPTASMVGMPVTIIGYGETVDGVNSTVKNSGVTIIASLDTEADDGADTIGIGNAAVHTCLGDSGGPAIYGSGSAALVLGVDSYGASGCTGGSHFRRTDAYLAFLAGSGSGSASGGDAGVSDGMTSADAGAGNGDSGGGGGCATDGNSAGAGCALALGAILGSRRRARLR